MLIAGPLCFGLLIAGCGGGGDVPGNGGNGGPASYLPLAQGNSWHYLMTLAPDLLPVVQKQVEENQEFDYHETVTASGIYDGVEFSEIESLRAATDEFPENQFFQLRRVSEDGIYARIPIFDEYGNFSHWHDSTQLLLPPQQGETWTDDDLATDFTTAAVDVQVTVPAGTFTCVRVDQSSERRSDEDESAIQYTVRTWYAQGVGIVKDETWEDDTKTSMIELVEYNVQ